MMVKVACAALLALASVPCAPEVPAADPISFIQYPLVHQVICDEGKGTAFRIGANHWLSVAHVTSLTACKIDGHSLTLTGQDTGKDFTQFDTDNAVPNGLKVNCGGFIPGHWYWAAGYAEGAPFQTGLAVYATFAKDPSGKRVLIGERAFIPGMSGGPVMDETGAVVGTVNAFYVGTGISLSRELKDTAICGANIA